MATVNIHDAKTHLSRLLEAVGAGETVVIAKAGRPVARVVPMDAPLVARRLGFMAVTVPEDFDSMGAGEIAALFHAQA